MGTHRRVEGGVVELREGVIVLWWRVEGGFWWRRLVVVMAHRSRGMGGRGMRASAPRWAMPR